MQAILPFPDISPEIFSIDLAGFHLALRWYALAYILGLVLAWRWVVLMVRRPGLWLNDSPPMSAKQVEDLLTWVILGVILGGRLGFVLFYQPGYYFENPREIPLIWQGGMSFHGGFIGVLLAMVLFARKYQKGFWPTIDFVAPLIAPGILFGRLGNFINGELWGRVTDLPWGMIFRQTGDNLPRHPSQLYEATLEGLALFLIVWLFSAKPRPTMAVSGVFALSYGIFRFLVEFVRQPDAQLGYLAFGWVTMGQVLSLPLIMVGVVLLTLAYGRRPTGRA